MHKLVCGYLNIFPLNSHFNFSPMKRFLFFLSCFLILSCSSSKHNKEELDKLAEKYVRLGLSIGQYDADFVDAYYGPDSLKSTAVKATSFPKDSLLQSVNDLQNELKSFTGTNDSFQQRANWMSQQLVAFSRRIKIFSGEYRPFDEESKELFGVVAPSHAESYFDSLSKQLDGLLPGSGTTASRFQQLANHFIIPKEKIDTVFKTAIAEARKRTLAHYPLPAGENFTLEYVTNKSWSGYNWYKGNFHSIVQINTDLQIFIERAIDIGSHESYPGHHVYNMLLEKNLYRDKEQVEISFYPLFSPQSLIAEGSANYGIEVTFPGDEKVRFAKEVLLPLAGLDTTGISLYYKMLYMKGQLNFARNEAARGLLNGAIQEPEVLRWLMQYCWMNEETAAKSVSFIKKYRSYVINYNYGQQLVRNYIESAGGTENAPAKRWELFGKLLSTQVTPQELQKK
ncbi:MAG: hypothetical protein JWN76_239 [Chitinophagaceae bacterium]|nr:hypothetical protein [Chitinophagaceae bacterium]